MVREHGASKGKNVGEMHASVSGLANSVPDLTRGNGMNVNATYDNTCAKLRSKSIVVLGLGNSLGLTFAASPLAQRRKPW
jgi:hypothetical protein